MSDAEQQRQGYIKATLDQHTSMLATLDQKLDAIAVSGINVSGRVSILEHEMKRSACPSPGKCLEMAPKLEAMEKRLSDMEGTRKQAFSLWKVIVGICVFFAGLAGFLYTIMEIVSKFVHKTP